jgi:hypothetical protein
MQCCHVAVHYSPVPIRKTTPKCNSALALECTSCKHTGRSNSNTESMRDSTNMWKFHTKVTNSVSPVLLYFKYTLLIFSSCLLVSLSRYHPTRACPVWVTYVVSIGNSPPAATTTAVLLPALLNHIVLLWYRRKRRFTCLSLQPNDSLRCPSIAISRSLLDSFCIWVCSLRWPSLSVFSTANCHPVPMSLLLIHGNDLFCMLLDTCASALASTRTD